MKLSPLTFIIIGISIAVMALAFGLREYLPNKTEEQYQIELKEKLDAEAAKMGQARKRVELATQMVNEKAAEWQQVVARRTPPQSLAGGGIDLSVGRWQLTKDVRTFRNNMQRAVNAQVRRGGVTVIAGPQIPFPPETASNVVEGYFNYPAIGFPVCVFDLGTITVQGTMDQIAANVRSWSTMPNYLAVTDGLAITGTSPRLTATYALSVVAYIRGSEISPPVPEGTGQPAGGGGAPAPGFGGQGLKGG